MLDQSSIAMAAMKVSAMTPALLTVMRAPRFGKAADADAST